MLKIRKIGLLALYFLSPLVSIVLFIVASPIPDGSQLRFFTAIVGIAAFVWLTYSFILMSRPKFLDRVFGMDAVLKFHKNMSIIALTLSLAHGLTLFLLFSAQSHNKMAFRTGVLAFALLFLLMLMSGLFMIESFLTKIKGFKGIRNRFGGKYNRHLTIHNVTLIATAILFAHLMLSATTTYSIALRLTYVSHFGIALSFWFNHKVIRKLKMRRNSYKITSVVKENDEVWTIAFSPNNGRKPITYKPGQYGYISISSLGKESHPYSFMSNPMNNGGLTVGIKNVGDYTSRIDRVNIGDKVHIDGPYGKFNHLDKNGHEFVFIAGGIGITPFLSMLQYLRDTDRNRKISLLWGVKKQKDMIYSSLLDELKQEMPNLTISHILSEDDSWAEDCGFIDREMLEKYGSCEDPDNQNKDYFICGPKLMTDLVNRTLREMAVSKSNIYQEQFSF